jgi:hypothetical protein
VDVGFDLRTALDQMRLRPSRALSEGDMSAVCASIELPETVFGRDAELAELRRRLRAGTSFVLHGDAGAGKTFLLRHALRGERRVLYCGDSGNGKCVFFTLASAMLAAKEPRLRRACGRAGVQALKIKSAIALRGLVLDALHDQPHWVVLDHLQRTSAGLAADIREILFWGNSFLIAVARSPHMEDLGFLASFFGVQSEKMRVRPFAPAVAKKFAQLLADRAGLSASNREEFLDKVVEHSGGLPGAITAMVQMAALPRYRSGGTHIKFAPLYIDFRLSWA